MNWGEAWDSLHQGRLSNTQGLGGQGTMAQDDLEELRLHIQKIRSQWQHKPPSFAELSALSELIIRNAATRFLKLRRAGRAKADAMTATLDACRGIMAAVSFCIPNLPDAIRKNLECESSVISPTGDISIDAAMNEARQEPARQTSKPMTIGPVVAGWGREKASASTPTIAMPVDRTVSATEKTAPPAPAPGRDYKTALARNIDRHRKECGWSIAELAEHTKLDIKLVLRHITHGKRMYPKTKKAYADAFGVKVADLEAEGLPGPIPRLPLRTS